jgi:hypothetical protein
MFRKAERKKAKLRLAIAGPSGSGKTYSALRIATGLGGPIALIDTERGSGDLYSDAFEYDISPINDSFAPEEYIKRINAAEQTGYNVLIIDSLSHAWAGVGGILDIKDHIAKSTRTQNDFAAWREATPKHNELVDTILKSSLHLIVTLRTKTGYEIAQDDKGKTRVQKLGLAFVQREGLEYEFTVVLDLSIDGHTATSTKDRTRLFDGKYFTPTEETGRQLLSWLTTGADPQAAAITEVTGILDSLNLHELSDAYWLYVSRKYGINSATDLTQQQLLEQSTILQQCHRSPERLEQFRQLLSNTPPLSQS